MTPTEAVTASTAGAAAVKVFPSSVVGPAVLAALRGPLPDLHMVPTGGITSANARFFIGAGAVAVGVGRWLTAQDDLNVITSRALDLIGAVNVSNP